MITVGLLDVLTHIHPMSDPFKKALQQEVTVLSLPKHHYLLEAPRVSDYVFFIDSGFATTFTYHQGKRQVEQFWPAGSIVLSVQSFLEQVPSKEFIQLEAASNVLYLHHSRLLQMVQDFSEASHIGRIMVSRYYDHCRERVHDFRNLDARARFLKMRHRYASIEQIVSQDTIASYLGVAPQSLSRIKRGYISK
jgi:CRP-like cAMP-binding protein